MIRQKQVDKASTVTYYLLLIISYYDCHDKYINIAWGPFWLNEEIRYDEIQYEMLKLHAFSPNFQPAHSPELCGRREDKLAASALGGNAKNKSAFPSFVSGVVANSCSFRVTSLGSRKSRLLIVWGRKALLIGFAKLENYAKLSLVEQNLTMPIRDSWIGWEKPSDLYNPLCKLNKP